MLTISKKVQELNDRMLTIRKELGIMTALFQEAVQLIEGYVKSSSCEQKFQSLFYLFEFSKRCHHTTSFMQELKPEAIMLDEMIERDVLSIIQVRILDKSPEQLCSGVLEKLTFMLHELEQLQLEAK